MSRCKLRFLSLTFSLFILSLTYLTLPISDFLKSIGFLKETIYVIIATFLVTLCYLVWKWRHRLTPLRLAGLLSGIICFSLMITIQKYDAERVHLVFYALLGMLYLETFFISMSVVQKTLFTLVAITFFALADEGLQYLIPGRFFEWHDVGINLIAAVLGLIFRGSLTKSY